MPTDPPSANQTNLPGPLGQAQPPAQQLPQHQQLHYPFAPQQQTHIPLHPPQQQSAIPRSQYGISGQAPLHSLPQASTQHHSSQRHPSQQRAPLSQPQAPFFPVNSYQQHMNPYPGQQFSMGGMFYQNPAPHYAYPLPGTNAHQQQTPVSSRTQRQFPQPVPSNPAQRAPARTVHVPPPRKKNILQIVDPDTNEEVKVSKVETRPPAKPVAPTTPTHPPVKIPPRRSHALELVSDPADETRGEAGKSPAISAQQGSNEATKNMVMNGVSRGTKEGADMETKGAITHQAPSYSEESTTVTSNQTERTPDTKPVDLEYASEVIEHQPSGTLVEEASAVTVSSSTSNTVAVSVQVLPEDRDMQETDTMEEMQREKSEVDSSHLKTAHAGDASQEAVKSRGRPEPIKDDVIAASIETLSESSVQDKDISVLHSSDTASSTKQVQAADTTQLSSVQLTPERADLASLARQQEPIALNSLGAEARESSKSSTEAKQDLDVQTTPSETTVLPSEEVSIQRSAVAAGSPSPVEGVGSGPVQEDSQIVTDRLIFGEVDRCVYVPSFMWEMKSIPNSEKASEYEAALGSRDILKNGSSSNPRRNDARGNRPVRGSTGPLSTDPRRAFPGQGGPGFQMVPMRGAAPPGIGAVGSLGSYDAFDLRSARSQAPPPAPKGQSSVRDGDPRGSRQQGPRGRFDGPSRQGQTPVDPFIVPIEKLKRTDKGWKRNRDADDEVTAKVKTVRSLLNKLTLEKFEKIFKQIVDVGITSVEVLDGVVTEIFEKTLFEPKFSAMYAELCRRLEGSLRDLLAKASILGFDGKPITFRKILLNHCRDEFTRFAQSVEAFDKSDDQVAEKTAEGEAKKESTEDESLTPAQREAKAKLRKEEEELKASKAKRRMLANVRFIGELFLKDLLREQIIHKQCIQKLLGRGIEKKEEDTLEALCKLISKTGAKLSENKDAINYIDSYFSHLHALSMDHTLPARIRFMLQDLIEQRANNWKVRREEVGAKTIAEIHQEVEKEERAKQEAQAAARERRNRGGSMHNRDRSQQNFTPRVAMTMASSRRSGPNVSRTNSVIEKFGNRGPAPMSNNNFQSLRLGPGGARPIGVGASGSGPLRPGAGTGMFGSFAPLQDNRESGMNGQSGDVRRGRVTKQPVSNRRAPPRPQSMPADKLKQKTRSVIKEFWSVGLLDEVRQTLTEEIQTPSYSAFVEEAVRISIDAKVDESEKSVGLLRDLAIEPLSGTDLVNGFSVLLLQLADLEMDNPRVTEFLGKYIGAVASTRKLPGGTSASFGLDFVVQSISETEDPKRVSKVYVSIFATLQKELTTLIPNEHDITNTLKSAYASLGVDVAGLMNAWNPMRGLSALEDMLKSNGVSFLAPYLQIEQKLKALLQGAPGENQVVDLLKTVSALDESLLRAVIRQSLDWVLMSPLENVKELFCAIIGVPLVKTFGSSFSQDVQMGAVLEAQFFVARNLEILQPRKVGLFDKPGAIAFDLLYDAEIVSRDAFMQWKEDMGRSKQVQGKDKMVIQTSQFFQWLSQLQQ